MAVLSHLPQCLLVGSICAFELSTKYNKNKHCHCSHQRGLSIGLFFHTHIYTDTTTITSRLDAFPFHKSTIIRTCQCIHTHAIKIPRNYRQHSPAQLFEMRIYNPEAKQKKNTIKVS